MARAKKKSGLKFEESIKKLEQIVERLEDEEIPLEESLKLFAEGKALARACEAELAEAENKVRKLIEDSGGEIRETALEGEDEADDAADDNDEDDDESDEEDEDAPPAPRSAESPRRPAERPRADDELPF